LGSKLKEVGAATPFSIIIDDQYYLLWMNRMKNNGSLDPIPSCGKGAEAPCLCGLRRSWRAAVLESTVASTLIPYRGSFARSLTIITFFPSQQLILHLSFFFSPAAWNLAISNTS
jgi:hypothetical protein